MDVGFGEAAPAHADDVESHQIGKRTLDKTERDHIGAHPAQAHDHRAFPDAHKLADGRSAAEYDKVADRHVTANEPQFLGHFPGNPVFPGVLLIEGMAQTAGAVCVLSQMGGDRPKHVYFLTIDKAKFRRPVVPGDTVEYHVKKIARKKNMWWFRGEAKVGGQMVAEAEVGAMVA